MPVRGFVQILQLILALQSFDEGFLRKILRVGHIAHDAIDQQENPAHVVGDKARLRLGRQLSRVVAG